MVTHGEFWTATLLGRVEVYITRSLEQPAPIMACCREEGTHVRLNVFAEYEDCGTSGTSWLKTDLHSTGLRAPMIKPQTTT